MSELYHAHQLSFWSSTFEHTSPDCDCSGKQCSRCEQTQCLGHFHRWSRSKDGYRAMCKNCRKGEYTAEEFKARRREHYKENADHINEVKRAWYQLNSEAESARRKADRVMKPEKAKAHDHRANTSEKGKQRFRRYVDRHPERRRASENSWKQRNSNLVKLYAKASHANRRARKQQSGGSFTSKEWLALKATYNYTCLCCGSKEPDIKLSPDHVVPLAKGGTSNINNIQPLCFLCNQRKHTKIVDYRLWK